MKVPNFNRETLSLD